MKRTLIGVLVATGLLLAVPVHARTLTIKLGTLAPEGSSFYRLIRDMAEAWQEASGGRIRVRVYPGGVAGDDPDMVRKMRVGQLQAAALTGAGLYAIAPEVQALQMPMMLASHEELDYVRDRVAPRLEARIEAQGFKVLAWGDAGWVHFFAQRPVVRPQDLRPLRLFVWSGDSAYVEAWKEAGYRPVALPATEIHTGLQSGLIHVVPTTPLAALAFQWFGLAPHMTALPWAPLVGAVVITADAWGRVPDDLKPLLLRSARDTGARLRTESRQLGDDAVEVMKRHGLVVHPVPPEARVEWEESARAGYARIVGGAVPAEIVAEVERLRDEYRGQAHRQ